MDVRNRVVSFYSTGTSDHRALTAVVRSVFSDVLLPNQKFFLQVKDEDGGGSVVELQEDRIIPDKSVIEAVPVRVQKHIEVVFF